MISQYENDPAYQFLVKTVRCLQEGPEERILLPCDNAEAKTLGFLCLSKDRSATYGWFELKCSEVKNSSFLRDNPAFTSKFIKAEGRMNISILLSGEEDQVKEENREEIEDLRPLLKLITEEARLVS